MIKKILPYVLMVFLVVIDQIVKWWVLHHSLYTSHVKLNSGFIFGLGHNIDLFLWVSCILIVILFLFTMKKPALQTYNLFVILGAALGNLIDRIFRGGVVDYWQISYFNTEIIFNLADVILVSGVMLYAWQVGKENQH